MKGLNVSLLMQLPEERLYKGLMHITHLKLFCLYLCISKLFNCIKCTYLLKGCGEACYTYLFLLLEFMKISAQLILPLDRGEKITSSQKSLKRKSEKCID